MDAPRILLIEDEASLRHAIAASLRAEGYEVVQFGDGHDIDAIGAVAADLAILDVMVPGRDGFVIARHLRRQRDVPVLFLTARDAIDDRLTGFSLGADDYVVKPVALSELSARVLAVLRRTGRLRPTTITISDLVIDEEGANVHRGGARLDLTATEFRLLTHLARHRGRVLSKTQLLTHVWGYEAYDPNVVEVHVSALRRKLEEHGPRLINTIRGVGYRMDAP